VAEIETNELKPGIRFFDLPHSPDSVLNVAGACCIWMVIFVWEELPMPNTTVSQSSKAAFQRLKTLKAFFQFHSPTNVAK